MAVCAEKSLSLSQLHIWMLFFLLFAMPVHTGSVLGQLLFAMYIHLTSRQRCRSARSALYNHQYADDTQLYVVVRSTTRLRHVFHFARLISRISRRHIRSASTLGGHWLLAVRVPEAEN